MSTTDFRPANHDPMPMVGSPAGSDSLGGQSPCDDHVAFAAEGTTSPQAIWQPAPMVVPPAGTQDSRPAIAAPVSTEVAPVDADPLGSHGISAAHRSAAAEGQTSPQATASSTPRVAAPAGSKTGHGQGSCDTHSPVAVTETAAGDEPPSDPPPVFAWPEEANRDLAAAADTLHDIERLRIASENRLRQFTRSTEEEDKDGGKRGFGWDLRSPAVTALAGIVAGMLCDAKTVEAALGDKAPGKKQGCCLEHDAERNLNRALRAHPLGPWVKAQKGVGEKQGGRLIAAIGNPYMRPALLLPDGTWDPARPRTVSELRSYCGYGEDKANPGRIQKRQRGQRANWSSAAKMRAYLVAEKCVVTGLSKAKTCVRADGEEFAVHVDGCDCSPYRLLYDRERVRYADAVHADPCPQCGPAGKPAQPGSPLSLGHKKNRALRRVAKEIIDDLWREARRIHLETPVSGQRCSDTQASLAADGD